MFSKNLVFPDKFHWGITSHPRIGGGWDESRICKIIDLASAPLGGTIHRVCIEWGNCEPREGHFDSDHMEWLYRYISALKEKGLKVQVVLQGRELPSWVKDLGGWNSAVSLDVFDRFTGFVASSFRGKVDYWCTFEDPATSAGLTDDAAGFVGRQSSWLRLANVMAAHGRAYRILHRENPGTQVGVGHTLVPCDSLRPYSALDNWASSRMDRLFNGSVLNCLSEGSLFRPGGRVSVPEAKGTLDYLCLNYRTRKFWTWDWFSPSTGFSFEVKPVGLSRCDQGLEVYPLGLKRALKQAWVLKKPILVAQSALADSTDQMRSGYLVSHLAALFQALDEGIEIMGFVYGKLDAESGSLWPQNEIESLARWDPKSGNLSLQPSGELFGEICRDNCIEEIWLRQFGVPLLLYGAESRGHK